MAKKKEEAQAPAISTIPLADQDSPLVIDLPDGQKLVVGQIAHGTVIEVATWRGTGRPDSRTSRLMLGVSSSANVTSESETRSTQEAETSQAKSSNPFSKFLATLVSRSPKKKRKKEIEEIDALLSDEGVTTTNPNGAKREGRVSKAFEDSTDIDSWLDDLMKGATESIDVAVGTADASPSLKVKRIKSTHGRHANSRTGSKTPTRRRKTSSSRRKATHKRAKTSKR